MKLLDKELANIREELMDFRTQILDSWGITLNPKKIRMMTKETKEPYKYLVTWIGKDHKLLEDKNEELLDTILKNNFSFGLEKH